MAEQTPKVNDFLERAVERKRSEVARRRSRSPREVLRERALERGPARSWGARLRRQAGESLRVIAEFKRSSPSSGVFDRVADPTTRAHEYAAAGAAAMSVLTDAAFEGRLADLEAVVGSTPGIPILRKDFVVDPWQVWESRAAGADALLLLVAALDDAGLEAVASTAREAGLGLLVEVHDPGEVDRALAIDPGVVGVNARDLSSFAVSVPRMLETIGELRTRTGDAVALVAESGIDGPEAARRAAEAGADAILVGEHLMRSPDPGAAIEALVAVGTKAEASS